MSTRNYGRLVTLVRWLFGIDLVVNGLNWWFKLVTPYPSISDFVNKPPPPDFVGAMIATGFIFHVVKGTELIAGIALLLDRFVPLALVAMVAVSVNVFLVDWFMAHRLRAEVMGSGELTMNLALMLAYLQYYRPLLAARAAPDGPGVQAGAGADDSRVTRLLVAIRPAVLVLAALLGIVMVAWVAVMMVQRQLS